MEQRTSPLIIFAGMLLLVAIAYCAVLGGFFGYLAELVYGVIVVAAFAATIKRMTEPPTRY